MSKRIAIVFSSATGQTKKIARYLEEKIQQSGFSTVLIDADLEPQVSLPSSIDGIIYGTPVYRSRYRPTLLAWSQRHVRELEHVPSAFFTVSLNAADRREQARPDDEALLRDFFRQTRHVPAFAASFAGALKYREYSWFIRWIMRTKSKRAGGDTDTSRDYEYTNWEQVDAFANDFLADRRDSSFRASRLFPGEGRKARVVPVSYREHPRGGEAAASNAIAPPASVEPMRSQATSGPGSPPNARRNTT
jgi:menaquinone-dependent protoporphyrinogen oxidase